MKKTLLIAAIGVAGLVSAKGSTKTILSESKSAKKEVVKKTKNAQAVKALFYRWGKRISPCGIVYYLDWTNIKIHQNYMMLLMILIQLSVVTLTKKTSNS